MKQFTKILGLIAVVAMGAQVAQAQEVGDAFRRADRAYGNQTFNWPKIDGKAVIAYWPNDRINGGDLNWSVGPNADKFCRSLGFRGQSGYIVFDVYQAEWDVGLNDDRGARTDYYMQPVYDYYRGWVPFGTFQTISCSSFDNGPDRRRDDDRRDDGRHDPRTDPGYGRHR